MEAQQPEALRALAEAVKGWNSTNVWPHEDDEEIAILGQINEDGEKYPVAEINVDTYFREGESIALAKFYAAANPVAVLGLLNRIAELERWQEQVRSNSPNLALMERAEKRVQELEAEVASERRHSGASNAAAVRTLAAMGYSWHGGEQWKAPVTQALQERMPLTGAQIASACLSYRHDYGLLLKEERVELMATARRWEHALEKEHAHGIQEKHG